MAYYLSYWLIIYFTLLLQFQSSHSTNHRDDQPYRTAYHFQPPKNWMNGKKSDDYYNIYSYLQHVFLEFMANVILLFVFGIILWTTLGSQILMVSFCPHCFVCSCVADNINKS